MHDVAPDPALDFLDDRDEAELLRDARAGDTRSADVLWIRVRPAALAVARRITGNKHDAEDLASEAMAKVFTALGQGQGPSEHLLAYLCTTMRNLHVSAVRREAKVGAPVELHEERVLELVSNEPDTIESELVTSAFKNLPARWRYVLWAQLVEGRNGSEIADDLGVKPTAVHTLKARALEGLRQGYLTEHAKLGQEEDCAAVHRDLAALVRGRVRRSTDTAAVWRHLRSCEHCAEGYRELSAINNRIGALLGPAAATLVGFVPHGSSSGVIGALRLSTAGQAAAAAGVVGAIALSVTTLTPGEDPSPVQQAAHTPAAVAPSEAAVVPATAARPASQRARAQRPAVAAPATAGCTPSVVHRLVAVSATLGSLLPPSALSVPTTTVCGVAASTSRAPRARILPEDVLALTEATDVSVPAVAPAAVAPLPVTPTPPDVAGLVADTTQGLLGR